jgi:uncharacterized protein YbjT (DUF2867 family)
MQILVLGGSGRTGRQIIDIALLQNHTVTTLVRNASSMTAQTGLTIIAGSPLNQADIELSMNESPTRPEAVIVALASVRTSDSPFSKPTSPPRLMTDSHINTIATMKKLGIKRIITVSAYGVRDSNSKVFWPTRMILNHTNISFAYEDHNALDTIVKNSGLEWTLVRPVMLVDGEESSVTVFGEQGKGAGIMPKITRRSVARFIVETALERGEWIAMTPVIAN